jgi:hypothetical protein
MRKKGEGWAKFLLKMVNGAEDDKPSKIQLRAKNYEGGTVALDSMSVEPDAIYPEDTLWAQVRDFLAAAQDDANGNDSSGPFGYCLVAVDEHGDIMGRSPAIKFHNEDADEGLESLEPSNSKGLLGQLMRHNETFLKTTLHTLVQQNQQLTGMVETMYQQQTLIEQRRLEAFERSEAAASLEHERAMERKEKELQRENMQAVIQQIKPHVPALMARLLSRATSKDGPADEVSRELAMTFKHWADSIPRERYEKVMSALGQDHATTLVEILGAAEKIAEEGEVSA